MAPILKAIAERVGTFMRIRANLDDDRRRDGRGSARRFEDIAAEEREISEMAPPRGTGSMTPPALSRRGRRSEKPFSGGHMAAAAPLPLASTKQNAMNQYERGGGLGHKNGRHCSDRLAFRHLSPKTIRTAWR